MVYRWEKAYLERGLSGLEDNRRGLKKDMTKPNKKSKFNTPVNESEREELIRLREENRFLKMKIVYEKKVKSLATGRGSRSKEKTKIILKLIKEYPKSKISE